jgi:dihydrolipoamide dehydrogenase
VKAVTDKGVVVRAVETGAEFELEADTVLMAIGRRANYTASVADAVELKSSGTGIQVDSHLQTSLADVYAVGDVTGINQLAYVSYEQGRVAAENAMGRDTSISYDAIPVSIFSEPEVAFVGLSEEEARSSGIDYELGRFPFIANGKARCMDETRGFVKILAAKGSGVIIGVHMIGPLVTDLIYGATIAVKHKLTIDQFVDMYVCHPTLPEAIFEAALGIKKRALHYVSR